jgi:hypothetical protein
MKRTRNSATHNTMCAITAACMCAVTAPLPPARFPSSVMSTNNPFVFGAPATAAIPAAAAAAATDTPSNDANAPSSFSSSALASDSAGSSFAAHYSAFAQAGQAFMFPPLAAALPTGADNPFAFGAAAAASQPASSSDNPFAFGSVVLPSGGQGAAAAASSFAPPVGVAVVDPLPPLFAIPASGARPVVGQKQKANSESSRRHGRIGEGANLAAGTATTAAAAATPTSFVPEEIRHIVGNKPFVFSYSGDAERDAAEVALAKAVSNAPFRMHTHTLEHALGFLSLQELMRSAARVAHDWRRAIDSMAPLDATLRGAQCMSSAIVSPLERENEDAADAAGSLASPVFPPHMARHIGSMCDVHLRASSSKCQNWLASIGHLFPRLHTLQCALETGQAEEIFPFINGEEGGENGSGNDAAYGANIEPMLLFPTSLRSLQLDFVPQSPLLRSTVARAILSAARLPLLERLDMLELLESHSLAPLLALEHLSELKMVADTLTDEQVDSLRAMPSLRRVIVTARPFDFTGEKRTAILRALLNRAHKKNKPQWEDIGSIPVLDADLAERLMSTVGHSLTHLAITRCSSSSISGGIGRGEFDFRFLQCMLRLESLDLDVRGVGADGARGLAAILSAEHAPPCVTLTSLSLRHGLHSKPFWSDASDLPNMLSSLPHLRSLSLHSESLLSGYDLRRKTDAYWTVPLPHEEPKLSQMEPLRFLALPRLARQLESLVLAGSGRKEQMLVSPSRLVGFVHGDGDGGGSEGHVYRRLRHLSIHELIRLPPLFLSQLRTGRCNDLAALQSFRYSYNTNL